MDGPWNRKTAPLLLLLWMALTGCVGGPPIDRASDDLEGYLAVVELPFVTNRAILERAGVRRFGNKLGDLGGGVCFVGQNPGVEHGDLLAVRSRSVDEVFEAMATRDDDVVVYIHGYYEDFQRSCQRAATFKRLLRLDASFLLFSWPANSQPFSYRADEEDLVASTPVLFELLDKLGSRVGPERVSVVAHSLGTRGAVNALRRWEVPNGRFKSLVLIAPDIDRAAFIESLPEYRRHVDDITVLVSDRDRALIVSEAVNDARRLGQGRIDEIEGVNLVDVTEIADTHFSGHVYHLRNPTVLDIIRGALQPEPDQP